MELVNNQDQKTDYTEVINYLMKSINKNIHVENSTALNKETLPVFLYEFFVFDLFLPKEILKLMKLV